MTTTRDLMSALIGHYRAGAIEAMHRAGVPQVVINNIMIGNAEFQTAGLQASRELLWVVTGQKPKKSKKKGQKKHEQQTV